VKIDTEAQEGRAEGAVLRFLGVPILALPVLSFPLSDDRKSGWLPPTLALDSRAGFEIGVPYYWNIAPNRDATITPVLRTRRGLGVETEFRYLQLRDSGRVALDLLPNDRVADRSRWAAQFHHDGHLEQGLRYRAQVLRVSDDDHWKDFPDALPTLTPRLLPADLQADREFRTRLGPAYGYARVQHWQVLQNDDPSTLIVAPYQRSPQLGVRLLPPLPYGLRAALETEVNRFTRPDDDESPQLPAGWRWHAIGHLSRPWTRPWGFLIPKLSFNAATYAVDATAAGRSQHRSRFIPTFSVDAGLVFERDSRWFGQAQRQTLEPRVLYVNTPFREQLSLPNFDSADREFNLVSLFTENAFTGVDRVSDAHQLTVGATSRWFDAAGGQAMRVALGQRVLFRDRRITSDGVPFTRRLSDVLLEASTFLIPRWPLDLALQYNPDTNRVVRSIVNARYTPGPLRTLSFAYRFSRGLSEQVEIGWQWPLYRGTARPVGASGGCGGTLYGVGRVSYSLRDSRITDSIVGFEYDAGCWIGRVGFQRLSTGTDTATTRLMWQLELVGLSRLGTDSLRVLKENVPGYQPLRDPRRPVNFDAETLGNP
jgi:LPS-assembly protein